MACFLLYASSQALSAFQVSDHAGLFAVHGNNEKIRDFKPGPPPLNFQTG